MELTPSFITIPEQPIVITVLGDSYGEISQLSLTVDGENINLDARGRGVFTPDRDGKFNIIASATDSAGRIGYYETVLKVRNPEDNSAPLVSLLGIDGQLITETTEIIGTINDSNLDNWTLEINDGESNNYQIIASGENQINSGILTQLNPQQFSNGFYNLRLSATDISGRKTIISGEVEINSAIKSNNYLRTETDLNYSFDGGEIVWQRRYNSLTGWSDIRNFKIELSEEYSNESKALKVGSRLYLTLPTGERVGFTFAPIEQEITGLTYYLPNWISDEGVNYNLESSPTLLTKAGARFYDLDTALPYNINSNSEFILHNSEFSSYYLDGEGKLDKQILPDNNSLIYSDSGIISSNGEYISFVTDENNNITKINSLDGTTLVYQYDKNGNLVYTRNIITSESTYYGYDEQGLLNVIVGDNSETISYENGVEIESITANLGGVTEFNGNQFNGNVVGSEKLSFQIRESELNSTDLDTILVSVSSEGLDNLVINNLSPVISNDNYQVYALDKAGLSIIEITAQGDYSLELNLVGDINLDGKVNAIDAQLLQQEIINGNYLLEFDLNRDGSLNTDDLGLLASNYGFSVNLAPTVTETEVLTHTDLGINISLNELATDAEGDEIFYRVFNPNQGTVTILPDGETARFTPNDDYAGVASFELIATDGYNNSLSTTITINVSDAPLTRLDFVQRNPRLELGESLELIALGDFEDQNDVILSSDYLIWTSEDINVANINQSGIVTGISNGNTIFTIERDNLQAVTVAKIGDTPIPTTESAYHLYLAEKYGLTLYPEVVTLTPDMDRQILIGVEGVNDYPVIAELDSNTRYFVSNPEVLTVDESGLITTLNEGIADVTVVRGGAEAILPVTVENPKLPPSQGGVGGDQTIIGAAGGVVEGNDGYQVLIPEWGVIEDTNVNITPVAEQDLSLPIPAGFEFAGAFDLALGDEELFFPAQLAIPTDLEVGTEVYIMRRGELPDETGVWNPIWLLEETGKVTDEGLIRTQSPPYHGIAIGGEYIVLSNGLGGSVSIIKGKVNIEHQFNYGFSGILMGQFAIPFLQPTISVSFDISSVDIIQVPRVGLPEITTVGVEINSEGIGIFEVTLNEIIPNTEANPFESPVIEKVKFQYLDSEPILILEGSNFLLDSSASNSDIIIGKKGTKIEDLTVKFQVGEEIYEGEIIDENPDPNLYSNYPYLGDNQYVLQVKPTNKIPLGIADIILTREQEEQVGDKQTDIEIIAYDSEEFNFTADVEHGFGTLPLEDNIAVFDATNPEEVVDNTSSEDLLLARIPVGAVGVNQYYNTPRNIALTSDAYRGYITLENAGSIALIDTISLQQVDVLPETEDVVETIALPTGAKPYDIIINSDDTYAYISDKQQGLIYVLDININSSTYHQVLQTISLSTVNFGLRNLAINSDGTRLFATAPNKKANELSQIFVINIDSENKPDDISNNLDYWHEQIAVIEADDKVEGITTTSDPNKMLFTNRNNESKGIGILTITDNDVLTFEAETNYISLGLGSTADYFDVNEAISIVLTTDEKYAFVAGYNSRFGLGIESTNGVQAGSNVGIISNPLGDNPALVAATRPIPFGLTSDLALSNDGKYLYASYLFGGGIYVFDVEEIRETLDSLENPTESDSTEYIIDNFGRSEGSLFFNENLSKAANFSDLSRVPIDDINPDISVAADFGIVDEYRALNQFIYGNFLTDDEVAKYRGLNDNLFEYRTDLTQYQENPESEVFEISKRIPIGAGIVQNLAMPPADWLELEEEQLVEVEVTQEFDEDTSEISYKSEVITPLSEFVIPKDVNSQGEIETQWEPDLKGIIWIIEKSLGLPTGTIPVELIKGIIDNLDKIIILTFAFLIWKFIETNDVIEQELFISTHPEGEGLLPEDRFAVSNPDISDDKLTGITNGQTDYNPNRIYLKWDLEKGFNNGFGRWKKIIDDKTFEDILGDDVLLPPNILPVVDQLNLTAGQTYYWGIRAKSQRKNWSRLKTGQFTVPLARPKDIIDPNAISEETQYSSVTFITPEGDAFDNNGVEKAEALGKSIVDDINGTLDDATKVNGTVKKYNPQTGKWDNISGDSGDYELGRPLVLIADWTLDSEEVKGYNSGFAEGAADSLFASLVALNSQLSTESLQDPLFNSPFHFIGMGRGAVVNSEIVQRLGTFYPKPDAPEDTNDPNYEHKNKFPDLQMTTIDPNDFQQLDTVKIGDLELNYYQDPQIQIWNNVNFADNYYQTTTNVNPRGRDLVNTIDDVFLPPGVTTNISKPNLSILLGEEGNTNNKNRVGFSVEETGKNPHTRTTAWYAGSVDLDWGKKKNGEVNHPFETDIHRRKGDFSYPDLDPQEDVDNLLPWYTPNHTGVEIGDSTAQWEGVGTGWYYSMLGGGQHKRSLLPITEESLLRTPVEYDNTAQPRMEGDFAVPTLFNGNFDAIYEKRDVQTIPGWGLHNGETDDDQILKQDSLVDWYEITNFDKSLPIKRYDKNEAAQSISYIDRLGIESNSNYALKLEDTQSIIHNRFIVPDWGALRFNLYAPQLDGGELKVYLKGENDTDFESIGSVSLSPVSTSLTYEQNRFRVGFGTDNSNDSQNPFIGFETFQIDDQDSSKLKDLRGQSALLKFELVGDETVYLDDVFFKSVHLQFGLPTYNGQEPRRDPSYTNNHLLEKPQYTVSYDNSSRIPKWVSRQLNRSWLGNVTRSGSWESDTTIPDSFVLVDDNDYVLKNNPFIFPYARGHMTASAERNRHIKDQGATFIFTNVLPQSYGNNSLRTAWENLERQTYNWTLEGKELYITSGGIGSQGSISSKVINVPRFTWKNILILDRPGWSVNDVLKEGLDNDIESIKPTIISVITSNEPEPTDFPSGGLAHPLNELFPGKYSNIQNLSEWKDWQTWRVGIRDIENITNLKLLPNIDSIILFLTPQHLF